MYNHYGEVSLRFLANYNTGHNIYQTESPKELRGMPWSSRSLHASSCLLLFVALSWFASLERLSKQSINNCVWAPMCCLSMCMYIHVHTCTLGVLMINTLSDISVVACRYPPIWKLKCTHDLKGLSNTGSHHNKPRGCILHCSVTVLI